MFVGSCLICVMCVCLCVVMSNRRCVVFLFCFSSSCVPYIASFSGLSILIAPSVFSNERKDMDVNEHERHFSHSIGFNNNQNSYAKMSVKRPVAYITELIHYEGR